MKRITIIHSGSLDSAPSGEFVVSLAERELLLARGIHVNYIEYYPAALPKSRFLKKICGLFANIWSFEAYKSIKRKLDYQKPDIVHFHGTFPYLSYSAIKAAHDSGAAVVQTLHNVRWICLEGGYYRKGAFCNDCVARSLWLGVVRGCKHGWLVSSLCYVGNMVALVRGGLFKHVDRFIAVSDFIRDQHILSGFPPDKIVVKKNPVNTVLLDTIPFVKDRSGIAFIGRVSNAKGVGVLKYIAARIKDVIHVVGDGPELEAFRQFCDAHAYTHVKIWGKLPQQRCFQIVAAVCCTVVPSQCGEAFSLAACESMGLATPVVGSDVGGLGNLLKVSGGGISVDPLDLDGFFTSVCELLEQPSLVEKLGMNGKRYVQEQLNYDKNTSELLDVYQSIIDERNRHVIHV